MPPPALSFVALLILTCPPEALARAGGGRNGGGGIVFLILLPILLIYGWYVNRRINQKKELTEQAMTRMAAKDPAWDEAKLETFVLKDFLRIENAWCDKDYTTLRQRLTENLFEVWKGQLEDMASRGHRNVMENLLLEDVRFVEAKDYPGKDDDEFTVCLDALDATAADYTIDAAGKIVDSNSSSRRTRIKKEKRQTSVREFWTCRRKGQDWLLAAVDQSGQWSQSVDARVVEEG